MSLKKSNKKFLRFYLGLSDEKEKKKILQSKELDRMILEQWENPQEQKDKGESFDKKAVFSKIQNQISEDSQQNKNLSIYPFLRRYAAILILGLIIATSIVFYGVYHFSSRNLIVEFQNTKNEKIELTLPDGSKVILNTKSAIKYPKRFAQKERLIELSGEAYLEVVRDTATPFVVKTKDVDIEVLGTSFDVMAYPDEAIIETTLVTGKVKLSRLNPLTGKVQSVILSPGHKATFYIQEERFIMDKVDVKLYTGWKDGLMVIDNESLETIAKKLERRYNVQIKLSDDIISKPRYTFTVEDESIDSILEIIKKTSSVSYTKVNGEIVFYSTK